MDKRTQQDPFNDQNRKPLADTGNASNPAPDEDEEIGIGENGLFNEKAEKYIREAANIEDMPDAEEQDESEKSR